MNYSRFINTLSAARKPSPIRVLTAILAKSPPSMISLASGAPNPKLFPYAEATFKLRDGSKLILNEEKLNVALQYGPTQGQADLIKWLKDLQNILHKPPTLGASPEAGGLDLIVTTGSQDGLSKSFESLINAGDNVLIECPTYAGTLSALRPMGCNLLAVATDHNGMIPEALEEIMSRWKPEDAEQPQCRIPKILYTIPNGVNPTGASLTLDRKQTIYKIAQKYNLLILEDDPYYFLQFSKPVPSFLSLDTDGRVLRFDSFSKVLSSGLRVGFVTGPTPLISRLQLHMMVSVMHTSALSQVMVSELLHQWGMDGFKEHVKEVVHFYRSKKDIMVNAAKKWLSGLAEWEEPVAGMFLWLKLKGIKDTKKLIEEKALAKQVLLVPGCAFMPDPEAPCSYVRASYSLASEEQIDQGFQRLSELIKEELRQMQN